MGGAVTGFTKAFARERPDALVKAVDVAADRDADEVAALLIEETLRDPGAVEVGHAEGLRWTVTLREEAATDGRPGMTLGRDTVFVVTGAAGSIVAAIVADLATASGGTFHLLDLVPEPDPANPDIPRLAADRDGLKRDIADRLRAGGERVTPVMVERQLAGLERAASALAAIDAVRRAGGTAHWHQVDLRDGDAVGRAVAAIREHSGRVDVLLHAGGLEISHFLPSKPQTEFDLVFDVKARRLVPPAARAPRRAARARPSSSAPSPDASATAASPTTARRTTCSARPPRLCVACGPRPAPSPSTGRRGAASAWPRAGRSRR